MPKHIDKRVLIIGLLQFLSSQVHPLVRHPLHLRILFVLAWGRPPATQVLVVLQPQREARSSDALQSEQVILDERWQAILNNHSQALLVVLEELIRC
jgi:hypothetical protein